MIDDIYAVSPMQAGLLLHRVLAPESTAYFDQFSCRLTGDVSPERLRRAWQQLVDRHQVLRTSFHWEGLDTPVQVVHRDTVLPWTAHDWRALPPGEQTARWHDSLIADRARGFDPATAPLMRVTIARVSERDYFFCWSHSHLLLDGWCLTLVLSELFARYDALAREDTPAWPPAPRYGDYIKWLAGRDRTHAVAFWQTGLAGCTPTPAFVPPLAGPTAGDVNVDTTVERQLSTDTSNALRATAVRHRLTLSTLVQGAWALVLSRYSGRDDVVFGTTVSGRPPEVPGIDTMLGVFINTVPARVKIPTDANAAVWLAELQAQHVAREAHAFLPLADIQKFSDAPAGTPLFDTNVIVMNYRMDAGVADGAAGLQIHDPRVVDHTDIPFTFQVTPGSQITLEFVYDGSRLDPETANRVLGHVEFVLSQMADDLDRPVSDVEIVTPAERDEIIDRFNATSAPLDPHATALDLWHARVDAAPGAIALECDDVRLTFRELDDWANQLARGLRDVAPAGRASGRDALVAIAFKRSERMVAAILAVWKSGAAYVPIDPDYPAERIRQVLDAAVPVTVIRDAGTLDVELEAAFADRMRFASIEDIERRDEVATADTSGAPGVRADGADLAYVIFTSGSTGRPKGAMVEHTGMLNHLLAKIEDLHLDDRTVLVQNASHCFDISVWQFFAAMLAGGRTLIYTDALVLDPERLLSRVRADRVTVLEMVPSYLGAFLDQFDADARPFVDLQFLLVTGETVKPSLVERWFARCPEIPLVNAYGPTEASDDITHAMLSAPPSAPSVPIGRPVRNFHIYIVDEQFRLCPIGVSGELVVSGPGVGRGYLGDPARTAAVFIGDPFRSERGVRLYRTGDIGWYRGDGTLFLAGRKDYQVKVRGYRIELGDIEAALTGLDAVRDAVVVERRDRAGGASSLAAYVSLNDPSAKDTSGTGLSATGAQILSALAERLPDYMIPASCTVLAALPLTANGKIDRSALPAPAPAARDQAGARVLPRTDAERVLAGIWGDVLGVDQPGVHDNFFMLGGDSILSMQIVSRASRGGLALTPRDVFQHQTIAELAAVARPASAHHATTASRRSQASPDAGPGSGTSVLAPAQQQFFDDVTVDRHHYNQSLIVEVPAAFDLDRCVRALDAVVRHHESLRLRFREVDGEWRQTVAAPEPLRIETHRLTGDAQARADAIESIGGRLQSSFNLERGPIVGAAYFDGGADGPGLLMLAVHHLAIDGVSWRIVVDDLIAAYDALAVSPDAAPMLPPVGTSFLDWVDARASARPAR
jgi:amino acid adenylation domain-containing protein